MRSGLQLSEIGASQFLAVLDAVTGIYQAAMQPPAEQLPGRSSIMERHAGYASFRAVVATQAEAPPGSSQQGAATPAARLDTPTPRLHTPAARLDTPTPRLHTPAAPLDTRTTPLDTRTLQLVGFAYGFHGARGQWWHDLVHDVIAHKHGAVAADEWLGDSFEIAEVHVHPHHQGHGAGREMMCRLTAGRPERTAVLSTMDSYSRARRLYRGLGFTDLVAGFIFPGTDLPYAIMGSPLPLRA